MKFTPIALCGLLFVLSGLFPARVSAAVIHVPDDYARIQAAIYHAGAGDTVLVRAGTYVENIDFLGRAVTVRSESGPEVTVIDGNQAGSVVCFKSGEGPDSVLDGFTLRNGKGSRDSWGLYSGGGIYCEGSRPTISGNIIVANQAKTGYGGGIFCRASSAPIITGNTISGNLSANCGGGIYSRSSSSTIEGNLIEGNVAAKYGGGITCSISTGVKISNNVIRGNLAKACGGGITSYYTTLSIQNNVIDANQTFGNGGGIYLWQSASPELTGNTIFGNIASCCGGGIALNGSSYATLTNSVVWSDFAPFGTEIYLGGEAGPSTLIARYCDVREGPGMVDISGGSLYVQGPGILSADPLFVDPGSGDFHLTLGSPCRDAGSGKEGILPPDDFEGDSRVVNDRVDMGADEFYFHLYAMGDAVPGGTVEVRITGWPDMPARLGIGAGVLDGPKTTPYGNLHLLKPVKVFYVGRIPAGGVLSFSVTVPGGLSPGDTVPLQALVGAFNSQAAALTDLLVVKVK